MALLQVMKVYEKIERGFEIMSEFALRLFVNSIVFAVVLISVSVWLGFVMLNDQDVIGKVRDCFIAFSFLTFFMIQRVLKKYNTAMHVKLNELVRAHENARNELINVEKLSDKEIDELAEDLHSSEPQPANANTGSGETRAGQK